MQPRERRYKLNKDVVKNFDFKAINLSVGGALLETITSVKVDDKVTLTLDLNGEEMQLSGIVRWAKSEHPVFTSQMHCGVEFQGQRASERVALRDYLETYGLS